MPGESGKPPSSPPEIEPSSFMPSVPKRSPRTDSGSQSEGSQRKSAEHSPSNESRVSRGTHQDGRGRQRSEQSSSRDFRRGRSQVGARDSRRGGPSSGRDSRRRGPSTGRDSRRGGPSAGRDPRRSQHNRGHQGRPGARSQGEFRRTGRPDRRPEEQEQGNREPRRRPDNRQTHRGTHRQEEPARLPRSKRRSKAFQPQKKLNRTDGSAPVIRPHVAEPEPIRRERPVRGPTRVVVPTGWSGKGEASWPIPRQYSGQRERRLLIKGGILGEAAEVELLYKGQHQSIARFVRGAPSSRYRRDPKVYNHYTGPSCAWIHIDRPGQLHFKGQVIRQEFRNFGIDAELEKLYPDGAPVSVITAGPEWGYRCVVKLVAGKGKRGDLMLGARNDRGHVVDSSRCPTVTPLLREMIEVVTDLAREADLRPYTDEHPNGLRYIILRQSRATNEILVTVIASHRSRFLEAFADSLMEAPFPVAGVGLHLNVQLGNAFFDRGADGVVRAQRLAGRLTISEISNGLEYSIGVGDFYQINPTLAEKLQSDVLEVSKSYRDYPMIDLYSGVGFFTVGLAKIHGWALGIESVKSAVRRSQTNAERNKVNIDAVADLVDYAIDEHVETVPRLIGDASPCFVVDPARKGLEDGVVERLVSFNPAAVLYVSCNPATLARDVALFCSHGWHLTALSGYDMFPQTQHVECFAVLNPPAGAELKAKRAPRRKRVPSTSEES